ncbi:hypothetical protein LCGC14_2798780 [marine sediment metagenome]|uniref:Uncharacterized protein n=1 Tax=marine sediment metagenome TaxID=412755 RepID=A0A0F9BEQ8_9ZZZZ
MDGYVDADIELSESAWTILKHLADKKGISLNELIGRILHDELDKLEVKMEMQNADEVKERDWKVTEEIKKRKRCVRVKFPIFARVICAVCGDAVRFERVWRVKIPDSYIYKFICQQCATTWDEAYDKGQDSGNAKRIYESDTAYCP